MKRKETRAIAEMIKINAEISALSKACMEIPWAYDADYIAVQLADMSLRMDQYLKDFVEIAGAIDMEEIRKVQTQNGPSYLITTDNDKVPVVEMSEGDSE